jgi:hypothetical protein
MLMSAGLTESDVRLHRMAKAVRWSYVIPSVLLTLAAAALLVWHVRYDPAKKIDAWSVALLIVVFLPWLGGIFETIEFPGGGKVQWRARVEAEQERQASEMLAVVQFLTDGYLTDPERELLQQLDSGTPLPTRGGPTVRSERMHVLLDRGLIAPNPPATPDAEFATLQEAYRITAKGRRYLDLIAKLPDENRGAR